ncbi:hypothetical protein ACFVAV_35510, partial [Nocardia sp. NPDC057663]|uniref:hypothetical protein n=1 Tax=Nocardia sp. NPDC057663 TaxID=3346201 RepID=UPI00366B4879
LHADMIIHVVMQSPLETKMPQLIDPSLPVQLHRLERLVQGRCFGHRSDGLPCSRPCLKSGHWCTSIPSSRSCVTGPIAHVSTIFLRFADGIGQELMGTDGWLQDYQIAIYLRKQGSYGKSQATLGTCGNAVPTS